MPTAQETTQPTAIQTYPSPDPTPPEIKDTVPVKYTEEWIFESGTLTLLTATGIENWMVCMDEYYYSDEITAILETVEDVVFSAGITEIPRYALCDFKHNTNAFSRLTKITLPYGLITIGGDAFSRLYALQQVNLPDTIEVIGAGAFHCCYSLESIDIPPKVTVLDDEILGFTYTLTELYIPEAVKKIGIHCFSDSGLRRIIFAGTIESIDDMRTLFMPYLSQLVFLDKPPIYYEGISVPPGNMPSDIIGLEIYDEDAITIYYLVKNAEYWEPNGETEWLGCKLVAIESLEDLPPIDW